MLSTARRALQRHYLWYAAAAIALSAGGYILLHGVDFKPGVYPPSSTCEADIGQEMGRHGHSEEFVWRGCRIANDTVNALPRFIPHTSRPSCVQCHDGKAADTLAKMWTRFPKVDRNGEAVDLATAIRREIALRYNGVPPNKADNAVTSLYFYMATKAKQEKLIFEVEPTDGKTLAALSAADKQQAEPNCVTKFDEKGWPVGPAAKRVVEGCNLVVNTREHIRGPMVKSALSRMNCQSCHRNVGDLANAASIAHGAVVLPQMMTALNQPVRFDRRIMMCFANSMNTFDIGVDAKEVADINLYANWLAQKEKLPIGVIPPGRGIPLLYDTFGKGQSFLAGKKVYETYCYACHSFAGTGGKQAINGTVPPPITGPNSFNKTASIAVTMRLAGFIHANMPPGSTLENPTLTKQQALDVAEYLSQMGRPEDYVTKNQLQIFSNWLWIRSVIGVASVIPKE